MELTLAAEGVPDQTRGRPQEFVLALLGLMAIDRGHREPIPARVFLEVLAEQGVSDVAARATLARMVRKKLLTRERQGREVAFSLTERSEDVLREGGTRILSPTPFAHPDGAWTLLSFSVPERHRDLRHRLRSTLAWAGFGPLRDGLWIAPGPVDVERLLADLPAELVERGAVEAFDATPRPPTKVTDFVTRAWDVEALRTQHLDFLVRWEEAPETVAAPLAQLTAVLADWIRLLRADPGLPAAHLPADWPGERSAATFHRLYQSLLGPAEEAFRRLC